MELATATRTPKNPSDIYACMLQIVEGRRGCLGLTKKDMKAYGVAWTFVEQSAAILGLKVVRDGRWGYLVSKA